MRRADTELFIEVEDARTIDGEEVKFRGGKVIRDGRGQSQATVPEDVAFAGSRIRKETIAAGDILHDLGACPVIASDSQAMGRVGEVIMRTWQTSTR